jgi:hypothetical protein
LNIFIATTRGITFGDWGREHVRPSPYEVNLFPSPIVRDTLFVKEILP